VTAAAGGPLLVFALTGLGFTRASHRSISELDPKETGKVSERVENFPGADRLLLTPFAFGITSF